MPGDLFFFRGLGKGAYAPSVKLCGSDGKPARAGLASALAVADWDGDGDLDLLVGNIQGEVWLLPNEGKRDGLPTFGARRSIGIDHGAEGSKTSVVPTGDAGPCAVDLDGDHVLDLIVGDTSGEIHLYKGTLENGVHTVHKAWSLLAVGGEHQVEYSVDKSSGALVPQVTRPVGRVKPCVCDWNGDGRLDLLVGDYMYFTGPEPVLSAAELEEKQKLQGEYDQLCSASIAMQRAVDSQVDRELGPLQYKPIGGDRAGPDTLEQSEYSRRVNELLWGDKQFKEVDERLKLVWVRLKQLRAPFCSHGYVWVYLRKGGPAATASPAR